MKTLKVNNKEVNDDDRNISSDTQAKPVSFYYSKNITVRRLFMHRHNFIHIHIIIHFPTKLTRQQFIIQVRKPLIQEKFNRRT